MIPPVAVAITILVLVAALVGMAVSWRLRGRRQRTLALPLAPGEPGTDRLAVEGLYLATTFAGRPLERVSAHGLGFRARARIAVTDTGVRIERDGAPPLRLPVGNLSGAGTATWTLDRAVEPGGLTVLAWSLEDEGGPVAVESSFRLDPLPRDRLIAAVGTLLADRSTPEVPHADA
ncbi:MAG TPA: ABC transporter permease [Amnibacterium sp.]|nr:ABC transporter permease [Amnibacterium sp.]